MQNEAQAAVVKAVKAVTRAIIRAVKAVKEDKITKTVVIIMVATTVIHHQSHNDVKCSHRVLTTVMLRKL